MWYVKEKILPDEKSRASTYVTFIMAYFPVFLAKFYDFQINEQIEGVGECW